MIETEYCVICTIPLNEEELYYYGNKCEDCEREKLETYQRWLPGEENLELDRLYAN